MEAIIGRKMGVTSIFAEDGEMKGVSAIEAGPCFVTQIKTAANDGYNAVQIGFAEVKRLNSPEKGHLEKAGRLLRYLREVRCDDPASFSLGQKIDVSIYKPGERVDVVGVSKGKGFAGGVKRHHFKGGPKTHGQSDRERAPGSIGSTTWPGRVLKGTRMAGHLGSRRVTVRRLAVVQADPSRNLLLLEGAVPGATGTILFVRKVKQG